MNTFMKSEIQSLINELLTRCTFPAPGTAVSCAVSGGADSLALLILAHAHQLNISIEHVDHGLRSDSSSDINVIQELAHELGINSINVHTVEVPQGSNLEARAREARYAVMPEGVLTGHTADDQAETLLINLLRGAGSTGLGAMRPGVTRPLLAIRRTETEALCVAMGVTPVQDSTNTDPRFLRNRIRQELLPLMEDMSRRDMIPILNRTAQVLRDDDDLLNELSLAIDPTDAIALAQAPTPLAYRALRRWLSDPYPPNLATLDRILNVAKGEAIACDIGENREIRRSKQRLTLHNLG